MKKPLLLVAASLISMSALALDARQATQIVKKYSQLVACQVADTTTQKNQFKAVKLNGDGKEVGTSYVVFWEGDVGCMGGNGTVLPQFTVVEQRGFESTDPIVATDYVQPEFKGLVKLNTITVSGDTVKLTGVTYGPKDQQGFPKQPVSYTVKPDYFMKTK